MHRKAFLVIGLGIILTLLLISTHWRINVQAGLGQPLGETLSKSGGVLQLASTPQAVTSELSVCSQHAPKCPLDPSRWPGEPDGWQFTGKKWIWYPYTINRFNRQTIWEYSQPYMGSNPDYFGQREDHYSDYTNSPDEYPDVKGRAPKTYDWERWLPVGDNYKVMQLGNNSETKSYLVGEADCTTGIFYPVVDHIKRYTYTPMYSTRWGSCTGGGYVAAHLNDLWGEPLSQKRTALCDNKINGIPAEFSPVGNAVCKLSPYVGTVYQRYIFGPRTPGSRPNVGCEAVLYAWGNNEPQAPQSGQDYQAWFRNGELRFSRWFDLSRKVAPGNLPAPDDHNWWNSMCEGAWTQEGNWLYSGIFRVGHTIYQDQASIPQLNVAQVTPAGGTLVLEEIGATYRFPQDTFTDTVRIVQYVPQTVELPPTGRKTQVGEVFRIFAEHPDSLQLVQPANPYTVSIRLSGLQIGLERKSLALYSWNGNEWVREPSSTVDMATNTVSATPDHFSLWAVLEENRRIYLPHVRLGG